MAVNRASGGGGKSPVGNIVMVAVALVVFLGAVAVAVNMMSGDKADPSSAIQSSMTESNSQEDNSEEASEPSDESSTPEESNAGTPASTPASTPTSTSKPTSSTANNSSSSAANSSSTAGSSSTPTTVPVKFDPDKIGSSGHSNISTAKATNSDVKGWLRIPGTNISHPVLYHATDVNYYMARDLKKAQSKNGVIWADPDTTFGTADKLPKNTVLYGHNWTNISSNPRVGNASDVMFGQLTAYHHLSFAQATPYIYYSTEAEEMVWKVFATFYTDIGFGYIDANPSDAVFSNVISGAKSRSRNNFDVDVKTTDKIITLSTCTRAYGSSDRQRFVVMARLLRSGEEIKEVKVTANPNPVLPKL